MVEIISDGKSMAIDLDWIVMLSTEEKAAAIAGHEETFSDKLALKVLEKPKLNVWMVLLPVLFVYFFQQYQRFSSGRKLFRENYLKNRMQALNEAKGVVESGNIPDIMESVRLSGLPEAIHPCQVDILSLLVEHYTELLRVEGNSFNELIRSVYKNKSDYILFINKLDEREKKLNQALEPHLSETSQNVTEIIKSIEVHSQILRRNDAAEIFR